MNFNCDVMVKRIFLILFILVLGEFSFAAEEGQIRFGAQAGHTGLMGDVGSAAGNALGFGGIFNYGVTDEMMLEMTYTTSSHTNLKHSDLGVGVNFYFNSYDAAYFYIPAGADFIGHDLTGLKTVSGFGLYSGIGVDFDLGKNFSAGLQGLYHKAFEAKVDLPGGGQAKAIEDYVTVMLRLLFVIPKSK